MWGCLHKCGEIPIHSVFFFLNLQANCYKTLYLMPAFKTTRSFLHECRMFHLLSWMSFWEHKYPSGSLWVGFACLSLFSEIVPHYCSYSSESLMVRNLFFPIVPVSLLEQPTFKLSTHAATTKASMLWVRCSATRETSATEKPPKREAPAPQLKKAWSHKP